MIANSARRLLSTILAAPRWCLIALLRVYQVTVSPWLGPVCRFHPTCSEYTIQAIEKYGALLGAWRGIKRVARCHPFRPGGFDPP